MTACHVWTKEIPIRVVSAPNQREHYMARARRVKRERETAYAWVPNNLPPAASIYMVRLIGPNGRRYDDDNLRGALKSVRDGIAQRLKVDDGDPRIMWLYGQEKASNHGVRVTITSEVQG